MEKIKKMLALLLAAIMVLTSFSTAVFAEGEGMTSGAVSGGETSKPGLVMYKGYNSETSMLTLEAYATGTSTTTYSTEPLDIVLVLDVSGSMDEEIGSGGKKKIAALKTAVQEFIDAVAAKSADTEIALVKFAGNKKDKNDVGDDSYTSGGYRYNYSQIVKNLTKLDAAGIAALKSSVNALSPNGATRADYGMELAKDIVDGAANSGRKKVVIMFTDGVPTSRDSFAYSVANSAISASKDIKTSGAKVYTIGMFSSAPSETSNTAKYMNYVSSNYPNAASMNNPGAKADPANYYKLASDASSLQDIFTSIASESGGADITLGAETLLVDYVSEYFDLPDGMTPSDVTVYTADCTAIANDGTKTWAARVPVSEEDGISVTINAEEKKVEVTGFNYSENWVGKNATTGQLHRPAKKLIVEFQIVDNETGFGYVPTNNTETSISGIYSGETMVNPFFEPQANFPYFTVVHGGAQNPTPSYPEEKIRMSWVVDNTFDLTREYNAKGYADRYHGINAGYLYGGAFESDYTTVHNQFNGAGVSGKSFTPVAGETYYIWEVPNAYLVPKGLSCWEHPMAEGDGYDIVDVIGFYLVTPVDREYYHEVGFDGIYKANAGDTAGSAVHFIANQDTEEFLNTDNEGKTVVITERDNSVLYNQVRIGLKDGTTDVYDASAFLSGSGYSTGYLACYGMDKETYWNRNRNVGATIEYTPYWITLDGVKVSQMTRTCKYEGAGSSSYGNKHKMVGKVGEDDVNVTNAYAGTTENIDALMLLPAYIADGSPIVYYEPEVSEVTITVHDNGNVYDVNVQPGNAVGTVTYAGAEGRRFAGWYFDEAFTTPADLTDVQEDVEIYARYIDDAFFSVKYMERGFFTVNGISVVSAVDTDTYQDTGFVINGEVISCTQYSRYFGILSAQTLFGREVGRNAKLMSCTYSLRGMNNGDSIVVTPYWVTPDGTTVYGETLNLIYNRYGLKG